MAQQFNGPPDTITLTENVTAGCNIVLWGLDWQAGDEILLTDCEHPGIIAIVQAIAARFGVVYRFCPVLANAATASPTETIAAAITPQTRLVILSHLLWNTGQVLPLADIMRLCREKPRERPIRVLVDAAQSAGSLPLDFTTTKVDFYAFTGHKWFCGPAGVGGLYINPDCLAEVSPTFTGWRGINMGSRGQPLGWVQNGKQFEVATSAYPQYAGLLAAIKFHEQQGTTQERYQQICQLSALLWQGLQELPHIQCLAAAPPEAGLVSFTVSSSSSHRDIVQKLETQRLYLRTIAHPDCIRACCHYFTTPTEIEQLLHQLRALS